MIFRRWMLCILIGGCLASPAWALNSIDIVAHSLRAVPHCLQYRIKGLCFWLVTRQGIPRVESTLQVQHYVPDAVVSVFSQAGNNAWDFARQIDKLAYPIGDGVLRWLMKQRMGHGVHGFSSQDNHVSFKEVDVIGHPLASSFSTGLPVITHKGQAHAFHPYFISMQDAFAWRSGVAALLPQSWDPIGYTLGPVT